MKAKTKEKIAKVFAFVVVIVMIFQVFLPLLSSNVIADTKATVTAQGTDVQAATGPETTVNGSPTIPPDVKAAIDKHLAETQAATTAPAETKTPATPTK